MGRSYSRDSERKQRKKKKKSEKHYSSRHDRTYSKKKQQQPKKEQYRFDSPPKEDEVQAGLLQMASQLGAGGVINNPQAILQNLHNMTQAQTAKIDRKLYVGNLPPGITQRMLIDVINEAMISLNVVEEPGNPVVSTWISSDGHYAFVEYRTADEANLGFQLQGMNIQGAEIKIGRPKAYNGAISQLGSLINQGTQGITPSTLLGVKQGNLVNAYHPIDENITQGIANPLMGGKMADSILKYYPPSRILVLKNIAKLEDTSNDYNFCEIYSDVMDKCSQFGKVLEIKIPRPKFIGNQEQDNAEDNEKNYEFPEGFGNAYIEFTSYLEAKKARRHINLMRYNDRIVESEYFDEKLFEQNYFKKPEIVKREKMGFEFEGLENCAIEFNDPNQQPIKLF